MVSYCHTHCVINTLNFTVVLICVFFCPLVLILLLLPQFVSIFSFYLITRTETPLPACSHCHSDETVSTGFFIWMNLLSWNSQPIKSRKSTSKLADRATVVLQRVGVIFLSAFMCVHSGSWNQSCAHMHVSHVCSGLMLAHAFAGFVCWEVKHCK